MLMQKVPAKKTRFTFAIDMEKGRPKERIRAAPEAHTRLMIVSIQHFLT
jgi:hypothetical protein